MGVSEKLLALLSPAERRALAAVMDAFADDPTVFERGEKDAQGQSGIQQRPQEDQHISAEQGEGSSAGKASRSPLAQGFRRP